jgi:hypothetical protein
MAIEGGWGGHALLLIQGGLRRTGYMCAHRSPDCQFPPWCKLIPHNAAGNLRVGIVVGMGEEGAKREEEFS